MQNDFIMLNGTLNWRRLSESNGWTAGSLRSARFKRAGFSHSPKSPLISIAFPAILYYNKFFVICLNYFILFRFYSISYSFNRYAVKFGGVS